jgi:hypothetical protein
MPIGREFGKILGIRRDTRFTKCQRFFTVRLLSSSLLYSEQVSLLLFLVLYLGTRVNGEETEQRAGDRDKGGGEAGRMNLFLAWFMDITYLFLLGPPISPFAVDITPSLISKCQPTTPHSRTVSVMRISGAFSKEEHRRRRMERGKSVQTTLVATAEPLYHTRSSLSDTSAHEGNQQTGKHGVWTRKRTDSKRKRNK